MDVLVVLDVGNANDDGGTCSVGVLALASLSFLLVLGWETNMQPILRIPATAILSRRVMRRFQIINAGSRPMVKSVTAAPTLYKYAMSMRIWVSMHLPPSDMRFQKWLTGEHWKTVKKKKSNPTITEIVMAT